MTLTENNVLRQFSAWVDAVIFVFSLENEASFNAIYAYYTKLSHYRNATEIPIILVGTQGQYAILLCFAGFGCGDGETVSRLLLLSTKGNGDNLGDSSQINFPFYVQKNILFFSKIDFIFLEKLFF